MAFSNSGPIEQNYLSAVRRRSYLVGLTEYLYLWLERRRQRHALLQLDDRMLKDIGISRYDAEREAGKPFYKA